jgi:hypothetical protein
MKTAMQEHINWLKSEWISIAKIDLGIALHIGDCIENAELMLEIEKQQIKDAASIVLWNNNCNSNKEAEEYYNQTYKTETI